MTTVNIIDPNIFKIFKDKQYLIILQGSRGSGKTYFSSELKKTYPNIEICSFDDFFTETTTEYSKNLSEDAFLFCKKKTKSFLQSGKTVIYNNTNLDDGHLDDIIISAKSKKICCIILRFFPIWDEEKCLEFAKIFHPITQSKITKQNIIRDNINLIHFQNRHKLGCFGIQSFLVPNLNFMLKDKKEEIIIFKYFNSSKIDDLKQKYLKNGYFQEKQKIPKAPKHKGIPATNLNMEFMQLPPSMQIEFIAQKHKVESLQKKVDELQEQLSNLSYLTSNAKKLNRNVKRTRSDNSDEYNSSDDDL
jgi:hypothetical protein